MLEIRQFLDVSIVIPAHNEEENIQRVIKAATALDFVDEVLVVDDGSRDLTVHVSKKAGARVISLDPNQGKGAAMKKGLEKANGDILVFLDADLKNITPKKIWRIIEPFKKGYDFVKTRFDRRGGRVTELTAKPLLSHFFPEIERGFEQPLSGQIGIKKELMSRLDLEDDSGVDLGILIDVVERGARTKQVYFGTLAHNEKELKNLEEMAAAVSRVILDRASRYKRLDDAIENIVEEV